MPNTKTAPIASGAANRKGRKWVLCSGSIRGALVASLVVGIVDTMGRFLLPVLLSTVMGASDAAGVGSAIASMLIYLLMAGVLVFKPKGLFPANA